VTPTLPPWLLSPFILKSMDKVKIALHLFLDSYPSFSNIVFDQTFLSSTRCLLFKIAHYVPNTHTKKIILQTILKCKFINVIPKTILVHLERVIKK